MDKIKILKDVMNRMEPEMASFGFKNTFSRQMFTKDKDQDFMLMCDLSILERYNIAEDKIGLNIEPAIFVHCRPVEKVYSKITTRKVDNVLKFLSIGNSLSALIDNPSGKFEVRNGNLDLFLYAEEDVADIAKVLEDYFKKNGFPYFEKNATWEGLDDIFNNNLSFNSVHCSVEPERSLRGLIVAKMVGRADLDELIKVQSERIRATGVERFEVELRSLLEILDNIVPVGNLPK